MNVTLTSSKYSLLVNTSTLQAWRRIISKPALHILTPFPPFLSTPPSSSSPLAAITASAADVHNPTDTNTDEIYKARR